MYLWFLKTGNIKSAKYKYINARGKEIWYIQFRSWARKAFRHLTYKTEFLKTNTGKVECK